MPYSEEGGRVLTWRPMLALKEPGQPHMRIRSPLRPSTRSSSFVQLLFLLTGTVPASTSPLCTRTFGIPFSRMSSFKLSICWMTPLYIFHHQSVTLQIHSIAAREVELRRVDIERSSG